VLEDEPTPIGGNERGSDGLGDGLRTAQQGDAAPDEG
jgi:hypothetical protein